MPHHLISVEANYDFKIPITIMLKRRNGKKIQIRTKFFKFKQLQSIFFLHIVKKKL